MKIWTLEAVVEQAITLYAQQRDAAERDGDEQARQFWASHHDTAVSVLRARNQRVDRHGPAPMDLRGVDVKGPTVGKSSSR